jgi:hypothetical protein
MSQYAWIEGRFKDGLERAGQALEIATTIGDAEVRVLATYALGLNQCLLGAHREAIALFERVLDGPDTHIARPRARGHGARVHRRGRAGAATR